MFGFGVCRWRSSAANCLSVGARRNYRRDIAKRCNHATTRAIFTTISPIEQGRGLCRLCSTRIFDVFLRLASAAGFAWTVSSQDSVASYLKRRDEDACRNRQLKAMARRDNGESGVRLSRPMTGPSDAREPPAGIHESTAQKTNTLSDSTDHFANWLRLPSSAPSSRAMALIPRASQHVPQSLTWPPVEITDFSIRAML